MFGRLMAIRPTERRCGTHIIWECLCSCGEKCFVSSNNLNSGNTKSCGCLVLDTNTTHGMSHTKEYQCRADMIDRCENSNNPYFMDYGGRGIEVCERWRNSFEAFYADMGPCPKGKSLDRWPDNDGDYEFTNCRWATSFEQRANCRSISCGPCRQRWFFAFNLDTGEWFENNNQHEFIKEHKLKLVGVSACLHGRQKTHKNWMFEFLPYQDKK